MTDIAPRLADRTGPDRDAELFHLLRLDKDLPDALVLIRRKHLRRDLLAVGDAHVDYAPPGMGKNRLHMVAGVIAVRLAVLCHDVQDIELQRPGCPDGGVPV